MASHRRGTRNRKKHPALTWVLRRAGLTLSAAGAVVAAGSGAATAAPLPGGTPSDGPAPVPAAELLEAAELIVGPLTRVPLHPLANTAVNPLDNSIGTQVADFRPISTADATGPLAHGASLSELPVVGPLVRQLPG